MTGQEKFDLLIEMTA